MKILVIIGTRPEAVKLFPVILALKEIEGFEVKVCLTGQHTDSVLNILSFFNITIDYSLDVLEKGQSLNTLCSKILKKLPEIFNSDKPDLVIVQGDTSSAFIASICAFYEGIKVAHVEAGLRTANKSEPFPEEMNRRLISEIADYHFAPTQRAYDLLNSRYSSKVWLTGNTGIDAVRLTKVRVEGNGYDSYFNMFENIVPITVHRRENWDCLAQICDALWEVSQKMREYQFVFITHPNEELSNKIQGYLQGSPILIFRPLDYVECINLINRSSFIITDSGGIQEEAAYLGKFAFVLRNTTERSEGVSLGLARLVGIDKQTIIDTITLTGIEIKPSTVYGDGFASEKIVDILNNIKKE